MVRTFRTVAAIASLLGVSIAADAAGLGKLTINSALGQVLNAEIDIVSAQPGELDSLSARVATPEAFREARIEYGPQLRLLRFSVDKRANGQPILKVTSIAPINEPFLDVLVDMSWPAGRLQREYPILLDPPGYAQGKMNPPAVAAAAPRPAEQQPAQEPAASPSTPAAPAEPSATSGTGTPSATAEMPSTATVTPAEAGGGSVAGTDTYGPVQKGETLNKIATEVKPSNVSLEQMLVALYRQNKSAFINNNMNLMKTGQILKVPTADEVSAIEQKDARQEIRTQVSDWKGYRDQLAGTVGSIPARPESGASASGKIASAAVTPPPPPAAESKDVLKLSRSDTGATKGGAGKGGAASQDRINALQEELTAKNKALEESQSRVADLEKQIQDMKRLMDLKAGAPTKAETKVAAAPVPPPAPPKAEAPKAEPPKVAEVKPEPPKVAEAPKTEPVKPAEPPKAAEAPKVAEAPKTAPVAPPKAAPKKAAPPPEPSLVDQLVDNWALIAGGLVGIGAIVGGFIFWKRRKSGAEAGPSSSMTSAFPSDLKPESGTGKPGGGLVDTGNSSFLTDFDKTGPGTVDTDEVDPVAEAEVYIAYGRDAQAEEILKEAMARDKSRPEIALKLLEIYHARKSATAFETVAKELHASVGDSSPLWQKAAAMGAQIDPSNALYAGAAASGASYTPEAPAAKPDVDFGVAEGSAAAPAPDFDIGGGDKAAAAPSIDFDLPSSGGGAAAPAAPAAEEKPSFDFDLSGLEMPGKSAPAPASTPAAGGGGLDLADLSLDTPAGGGGEGAGTKLELAKAYLEIGDKDGARDILNEVAKEGSAEQKEEAKKLIASL